MQHVNSETILRRRGRTTPAALPQMMRAIAIDRLGGVDQLSLHTLPVPRPGAGEILIELHTVGVGSWDIDMREHGVDSGDTRFPFVPGVDGAGTVVALGRGVRRFGIGDRVYAYSYARAGFYAEYVKVSVDEAARVPGVFGLEHAGAVPAIALTALQGIDDALHLKADEKLLVFGASGGVGSMAVQFAKLRRAQVLATASGEDGLTLVRKLGADFAVDARREDLADAARRFAPDGMDAVLALAGGEPLENGLRAVRAGGRLAFPNGVEPEPKGRSVHTIAYDGIAGVREFRRLGSAIEAMALQVPIAASFPLEQARDAHERVAAGHVLGKVVLRIRN
jgi:NADPH:quinone reductase-like Zn-dependent oxidoreductase